MDENHHSSAAPPNAKGGSGASGCPENENVAMPNLSSSSAEVAAATAATSNDDVSKGKSVAADDDKELKPHIVAERKRRSRMRDYSCELQALIPQIPEKSDKATIVGHAIHYIRSLEKTKAMLEKRRQELALAQQAAAEAVASSSSAPLPPQTAQGLALVAMSSDVPDVPPPPLQQPLAAAEPAPPQLLVITARQVGSQTWSWPNLVLSVSNDAANINVCAPRHRGMWTMVTVLSVLNKHGIDVVSAQVDSDAVRSVFNIYARLTSMGGENPSALEVYQLAVSEILLWLTTC